VIDCSHYAAFHRMHEVSLQIVLAGCLHVRRNGAPLERARRLCEGTVVMPPVSNANTTTMQHSNASCPVQEDAVSASTAAAAPGRVPAKRKGVGPVERGKCLVSAAKEHRIQHHG